MCNWSRIRTALLLVVAYGVLSSATAVAGIEEHNPNPMPEWLQQELAVYTTDGVDEARAVNDEEEDVEHDEPDTTWASGATHLQQFHLDEHTLIKWRLALHGLQYVTIEELLSEEQIEEEEKDSWDSSEPNENESGLSEESNESEDGTADSLESVSSALTRDDPGFDADSADPIPLGQGCSTPNKASLPGFGILLFLVWLIAARLRWS
jgi:hypothetical protein